MRRNYHLWTGKRKKRGSLTYRVWGKSSPPLPSLFTWEVHWPSGIAAPWILSGSSAINSSLHDIKSHRTDSLCARCTNRTTKKPLGQCHGQEPPRGQQWGRVWGNTKKKKDDFCFMALIGRCLFQFWISCSYWTTDFERQEVLLLLDSMCFDHSPGLQSFG